MTCLTKTYPSVTATTVRARHRPAFVKALILVIEAFADALAMMRAAHRRRPFGDE